jgi:monofunctional biosynthetic peptidoglycan transglycosylase
VARVGSWSGRLLRPVLWLCIGFLLVSILMVALLRWLDPGQSAMMLESRYEHWRRHDPAFALRHQWVALNAISPNLPLAVVASEDQKFPDHWGFDVQAIENAYAMNQHRHQIHGASTISQQVAKNVFLWSGRSYVRKALEAYFTVLIEICWSKRRILEVYLNVAQFGPGVYGAEAAAQHFFRKPASALSRSDAATLAAVLPNPERFSAAAPSVYIQGRRSWILDQMQALGGPEMLNDIDAYPHRRH